MGDRQDGKPGENHSSLGSYHVLVCHFYTDGPQVVQAWDGLKSLLLDVPTPVPIG